MFHQQCWNGVRAHARQLTTEDEKQENKALFDNNPDAWRESIRNFLPGGDRKKGHLIAPIIKREIVSLLAV